ncbi:aspartyl-phosphate phosphatase Spo0E family protein [Ammoniphilus sp. 3BR4]|uniref:aspartyl-phosphate phosphatase Spo0E family protein n=1 Tax=Ammoniphilus sp. 3BR4 TaxID=3158265 RepID=UPI00346566E3
MILHELVKLTDSMNKLREDMHQLALNEGLTHPEVIMMSQGLDELINRYQKIIFNFPIVPKH